jgi:hypothetical protein
LQLVPARQAFRQGHRTARFPLPPRGRSPTRGRRPGPDCWSDLLSCARYRRMSTVLR